MDTAIAQLVSEAVAADEVIDVYAAAGMERPDLSILSDEFLDGLDRIRAAEPPDGAAAAAAQRPDPHDPARRNVVQARQFSELLDEAIRRYTNRALTTAEIIAELVELAKEMRDAERPRRASSASRDDELAFYDAILPERARRPRAGRRHPQDDRPGAGRRPCASRRRIDWNLKETVRAALRAKVRRLLTQYDYPPDKEERAIQLVLEQAELFAEEAA